MPNLLRVKTLNREAHERWDDDGGAMPLDLAIQQPDLKERAPTAKSNSVLGANDSPMLLNQLEVANRYFTESEHRVTRQQNLISKLREKRQTTISAVEFLRSLQASLATHRAGRNRLLRSLAILDASGRTIEPTR